MEYIREMFSFKLCQSELWLIFWLLKMKILALLLVSLALFNSVLGLCHEESGSLQAWLQSFKEVCFNLIIQTRLWMYNIMFT